MITEKLKRLTAWLSLGRVFPEHHPRWIDLPRKDSLAARGEFLAERELKRRGYRILGRRWRWHRFELDLIARRGDVVAVVEVKTRRDDRFGAPQEAVPIWKQRRIAGAARAFAAAQRLENVILRFDVVAVVLQPGKQPDILYIENAFTP